MKVFLNENSIPEKAANPEEIYSALSKLIAVFGLAKKVSNNQQIRRHRDLKNKEVLVGKTLAEYIMDLGNDTDPNRRKLKTLFLELFAKAPFLTGFHGENDSIRDIQGGCLKSSCFDDASSCRTGAAVISAEISGSPYAQNIIVESSIFGRRNILNITTLEQLEDMLWIYECNEKHEIPKDILVDGEQHSAMHLTREEAQRVLSNGVMIGRCIFNKVEEQWYKFHRHDRNIYHGFPIDVKTPYKEFSAARILFKEIDSNTDGQLLEELISIRRS